MERGAGLLFRQGYGAFCGLPICISRFILFSQLAELRHTFIAILSHFCLIFFSAARSFCSDVCFVRSLYVLANPSLRSGIKLKVKEKTL